MYFVYCRYSFYKENVYFIDNQIVKPITDISSITSINTSALARKIKGQGNFANLRALNARECCDRAGGGAGRELVPHLNKKLFENNGGNGCFRGDFQNVFLEN